MKTAYIALFAVLASLAFAHREERVKFDPKRDAAKDIAAAVVLAKKQDKRIILDVGGEWCPWCKKLDQFFIDNKDCSAILKAKFVVVKVNFSEENKNEAMLSKYPKISGYPHLFVLEKDGKLLHSQDTGLLESGDHHDHDKMLAFLKKWTPQRVSLRAQTGSTSCRS